ncbi:MAG: hypothetical protein IJS89_07855 [Bacteroidaceae bacterium]|nr:hypothetical protein [Bacteroidaceae bacterium]
MTNFSFVKKAIGLKGVKGLKFVLRCKDNVIKEKRNAKKKHKAAVAQNGGGFMRNFAPINPFNF